jgi:hypothetical protein
MHPGMAYVAITAPTNPKLVLTTAIVPVISASTGLSVT